MGWKGFAALGHAGILVTIFLTELLMIARWPRRLRHCLQNRQIRFGSGRKPTSTASISWNQAADRAGNQPLSLPRRRRAGGKVL